MRIKSYFTYTVESAVALAQSELGDDALLVSARRSPPDSPDGARYEVVFAVEQESQKPAPAERRLTSKDLLRKAPAAAQVVAEVCPPHPNSGMIAEIAARVSVSGGLGTGGGGAAKVALVGPCGAGKTSMIVKLAVRYGILAGRRTHLLSADTNRVGSSEPLRSYARLLGLRFSTVEDAASFHEALGGCSDGDLVLIDTPGLDQSNAREGAGLAQLLAPEAAIDTHLVVPASLQPRAIQSIVDRFQIFHFAKLLFTRLDEADSVAGIFLEAARARKPLSFWSTGPDIPDGFEPANKTILMERLLGPRSLAAQAR